MNRKTKFIIIFSLLLTALLIIFVIFMSYNPQGRKRNKVEAKLYKANSIEECKKNATERMQLDPACLRDQNPNLPCIEYGEYYDEYMSLCMGNLALRKNDKNICFNKKLNEEICTKWSGLAEYQSNDYITKCVKSVETKCTSFFKDISIS